MNNSDFIALLVGSLGVMITLVVGWQIYQLFSVNQLRKQMEEFLVSTQFLIESNNLTSAMMFYDYYYSRVVNRPTQDLEYNYISNGLHVIRIAASLKNYDIASNHAKAILESVPASISMSAHYKKLLMDTILSVPSPGSIPNFHDLVVLVAGIRTTV